MPMYKLCQPKTKPLTAMTSPTFSSEFLFHRLWSSYRISCQQIRIICLSLDPSRSVKMLADGYDVVKAGLGTTTEADNAYRGITAMTEILANYARNG